MIRTHMFDERRMTRRCSDPAVVDSNGSFVTGAGEGDPSKTKEKPLCDENG